MPINIFEDRNAVTGIDQNKLVITENDRTNSSFEINPDGAGGEYMILTPSPDLLGLGEVNVIPKLADLFANYQTFNLQFIGYGVGGPPVASYDVAVQLFWQNSFGFEVKNVPLTEIVEVAQPALSSPAQMNIASFTFTQLTVLDGANTIEVNAQKSREPFTGNDFPIVSASSYQHTHVHHNGLPTMLDSIQSTPNAPVRIPYIYIGLVGGSVTTPRFDIIITTNN